MNDERLLRDLGSWLKDADTAHPDVERITARAMSQVPQVRQRGRWWPLSIPGVLRPEYQPVDAPGAGLFSALKLVAAGVIVGLFGGFLLAGLLIPQGTDEAPAAVTEPPSPMTTELLLSMAETTEVEPGVLQVIDDGVRDIASTDDIGIVSGADGSMWLLSDAGFLRLGSEGTYEWPSGQAESVGDFAVAPDGTVWTVVTGEDGVATVRSFDGEGWTVDETGSDTHALGIAADGTVWALWQDEGSETVALGYLSGDVRQPVGAWPESELHDGDLYLSGTDGVWVSGGPLHLEGKPRLKRLVDGALQQQYEDIVVAADVGPDGDVWFVSTNELIHLDGTVDGAEPEPWALPEQMTTEWVDGSGWSFLPGDAFKAAPDGGVWFALRADSAPPLPETHCGGVAGFDGTTWLGPYLSDLCVDSIDLAADGSVWVLARDAGSGDEIAELFVVTPEGASAAA